MVDLIIENCIEISGKEILMDSLSKERRREISEAIQDRFMEAAAHKRKNT